MVRIYRSLTVLFLLLIAYALYITIEEIISFAYVKTILGTEIAISFLLLIILFSKTYYVYKIWNIKFDNSKLNEEILDNLKTNDNHFRRFKLFWFCVSLDFLIGCILNVFPLYILMFHPVDLMYFEEILRFTALLLALSYGIIVIYWNIKYISKTSQNVDNNFN